MTATGILKKAMLIDGIPAARVDQIIEAVNSALFEAYGPEAALADDGDIPDDLADQKVKELLEIKQKTGDFVEIRNYLNRLVAEFPSKSKNN